MRAFEIPADRADQVNWLESELLGTELHALVAELQAVHGDATRPVALSDETLAKVRERGLGMLTNAQFSELLRQPTQLLELQQDVLEHGGQYWSRVAPPSDLAIKDRLHKAQPVVSDIQSQYTRPSTWQSHAAWALVASIATAAAVLLIVRPNNTSVTAKNPSTVVATTETAPITDSGPAWGFAKFATGIQTSEQDLQPPLDRAAYLRELAKAAEAWTNKRPVTQETLARRIGEFRMGCSAILLATHGPLPESDRKWLRTRCQSWATALDRHLAAVEAGGQVDVIRAEVDATVVKIAAALQGRADTPTG